jgi:hypothetical protein
MIELPSRAEFDSDDVSITEANDDHELTLVEFGFQVTGLPPSGGEGMPDIVEVNATENIAALSFITANGKTADSGNTAHCSRVIGFVQNAALSGHAAQVIVEGDVTYSGWSWAPSQELFLNGTSISATPPNSGFSQLVAVAQSAQTIFVRLQQPIQF